MDAFSFSPPIIFVMDFNTINSHPRDLLIHFNEEEHSYYVDTPSGAVMCDSVTTIIESLFEKFDCDYWAQRKATPTHTAEQIKAEWAEKGRIARELGTLLHSRIENYYLGKQPDEEALSDHCFNLFLRFASSQNLTPYRSEWRIFSERARIAGTLDFLTFDGTKFEIYDWKRSSKVVDINGKPLLNSYNRYAFEPICRVPDTTFHHYALQVSIYRYILELEYGIKVAAAHLGAFHPDYDRPHIVDIPYLRDEAIAIFNHRQ